MKGQREASQQQPLINWSANNRVLVILGPTGSGKTSLGVKSAQKLNGEVISADSRAIYKGMDIGTAKPTVEERQGVPHYGLDLVEPNERFTVADFKTYAKAKIQEIWQKNKLPIIVGGTGLYIDAVIFDYQFRGRRDKRLMILNKKVVQTEQR